MSKVITSQSYAAYLQSLDADVLAFESFAVLDDRAGNGTPADAYFLPAKEGSRILILAPTAWLVVDPVSGAAKVQKINRRLS